MKRSIVYLIIVILVLSAGCVNYLQTKFAYSDKMYEGPYQTRDQIAILVQSESEKVHLQMVNGTDIHKELGVIFEFLPGQYSLCISLAYLYAGKSYHSETCQVVEVMFQAGHTYEFYGVEENNLDTWHPAVRDITDDLKKPENEGLAKKIDSMFHNAREKQNKSHN